MKINIQRSIEILVASSGDPFCSRRHSIGKMSDGEADFDKVKITEKWGEKRRSRRKFLK